MKLRLIVSQLLVLCVVATLAGTSASPARAATEDECAVWLCLPAGFVTAYGCAPAYAAFLNRIKKGKSGLVPFYACSGGSGGGSGGSCQQYGPMGRQPATAAVSCHTNFTFKHLSYGMTASGIKTSDGICHNKSVSAKACQRMGYTYSSLDPAKGTAPICHYNLSIPQATRYIDIRCQANDTMFPLSTFPTTKTLPDGSTVTRFYF